MNDGLNAIRTLRCIIESMLRLGTSNGEVNKRC